MKSVNKGIIFIVDISGYSRFVKQTEPETGALIIADLLNTIISQNNLSFKISEIEGDAVLFYHFGAAYPIRQMLNQFEEMLYAFNREIETLMGDFPQVSGLSIKSIVHYGEIGGFSVGGFRKLYGHALIEAHRLLKNHIGLNTYTLITQAYIEQKTSSGLSLLNAGGQLCEMYDVGKICYTYFPYTLEGNTHQLRAIA